MNNPWNITRRTDAFSPWPPNESREIVLRNELALLFYGGDGLTPKSYPILYRRLNKQQVCSCVKDGRALSTCPICSGEMFTYTDYIYHTRHRVVYGTGDTSIEPTILAVHRYIFYFEYWVNPMQSDVIFDIHAPDHKIPSTIVKYQRFLIESVDVMRDIDGRIAFYQCWCQEQIIGPSQGH